MGWDGGLNRNLIDTCIITVYINIKKNSCIVQKQTEMLCIKDARPLQLQYMSSIQVHDCEV